MPGSRVPSVEKILQEVYGDIEEYSRSNKSNMDRSKRSSRRRTDSRYRHRKHEDDSMTAGARCCFGLLILIAQILLNGVMALCLYWVIQYRSNAEGKTFAWKDDPDLEFNLHPVLMIAGFIYFMGQAMLMYRTCRCCRRIWNKLLHTVFHILSIPCIAIAFIAVLDSHNLRTVNGEPAPIPNFYSLHSWIGLAAMGLFALQFMVGFFSFLLLLCCESATASFRASLVPIHSTFGISTFVLAVAAACSGLTEKAFFSLSLAYNKWVPYLFDSTFNKSTALAGLNNVGPAYDEKYFEESLVINVMGGALVILAVVIPLIVSYPKFRYRPQRIVTVTHDRYG